MALTFESMDEILSSDHSNETSLPVLLHLFFKILQNEIWKFVLNFALGHIWQ